MLHIQAVPVLTDNFAWLLEDTELNICAIIDPGEAEPIQHALAGRPLSKILLTHHHRDHCAGAEALRARYGAIVFGSAQDRSRLPKLDIALSDRDRFHIGKSEGIALEAPGHTRHHLLFYFHDVPAVFSGDALFNVGCGRLFEGDSLDLYKTMRLFDTLPDETSLCPGHDYTINNLLFAQAVDPSNQDLSDYAARAAIQSRQSWSERQTTLGLERRINPFLRAENAAVLKALRAAKDGFS